MERVPDRLSPEEIPLDGRLVRAGRYPSDPSSSLVLPDDAEQHLQESTEALKRLREEHRS